MVKIIGTNDSNEQKLLEEKREKINELIGLNNISIKERVTLLINDWCAEHIKTLHSEYPHTEWLAVCKIEPQGNGVFIMTDMLFPGQQGSGGEVDTTKEGMERLNKELIERGENGEMWNCILHSHHNMGCFWSGTDDRARIGLNDGRQLAWAVVTAYDKNGNVDYKGCVNFYKPYNIEIDVNVVNITDTYYQHKGVVEKYNDYLQRINESEVAFYEFLTEENKEYIDSITQAPSYANLTEYLGVDITKELKRNYEKIKDKIGNPELLDYLEKLNNLAHELAVSEVNNGGTYSDVLKEYNAFCEWSDNLLTQLEENRKTTNTVVQNSFVGLGFPTNRTFDCDYDDYEVYEITSNRFSERYVRQTFKIDNTTPMKVGDNGEWLVWCDYIGDYLYVEYWAEDFYDCN